MCNGYSSIVALLQFYSISACIHLERPFLPILLLEEPCSSVRSLVTYFTPFACAIDQQLWIWGRASTGACVTRPGREGRYQAGPKGCSLEVGARRAPRLLVSHISVLWIHTSPILFLGIPPSGRKFHKSNIQAPISGLYQPNMVNGDAQPPLHAPFAGWNQILLHIVRWFRHFFSQWR